MSKTAFVLTYHIYCKEVSLINRTLFSNVNYPPVRFMTSFVPTERILTNLFQVFGYLRLRPPLLRRPFALTLVHFPAVLTRYLFLRFMTEYLRRPTFMYLTLCFLIPLHFLPYRMLHFLLRHLTTRRTPLNRILKIHLR